MTQWDEESVAAELLACEAERRDREPFTDEWPDLDVDTGYRIQDANPIGGGTRSRLGTTSRRATVAGRRAAAPAAGAPSRRRSARTPAARARSGRTWAVWA
jgi:hypothetical protein